MNIWREMCVIFITVIIWNNCFAYYYIIIQKYLYVIEQHLRNWI